MPTARYQHGGVFVGARLHISGGAVGGGRMVDDQSSIVVLDTAAGTWCTQADPTAMNGAGSSDDWARRYCACLFCRATFQTNHGVMKKLLDCVSDGQIASWRAT